MASTTPPRNARTIDGTNNRSVVVAASTRNNGRYNGNGRHWATPPEVFDPLHREFDFTLDPCCTPETAKASTYFTEAEDGLAQDWSSLGFVDTGHAARLRA